MFKHSIKISLILIFLCVVSGCVLILKPEVLTPNIMIFSGLFLAGLVSWIYVIVRAFIFRKKLVRFFNYMLTGNYEIGIKPSKLLNDEISRLINLINKASDQLRRYDELRAERVKFNYLTVDALCKNSKEAIIIADTKKGLFQLNPGAQSIFEVRQDSYTFGSVEKLEDNKEFISYFKSVVDEEKVSKEASVKLRLPGTNSAKEIAARIMPLKDKHERVRVALIYLNKGGLMSKLHMNI